LLSICFAFSNLFSAGMPKDYYDGTDGLTGEQLKSKLNDIIDGHHEFGYGSLWEQLSYTDEDPNNSNNVRLLYTGWSYPKSNHGGGSSQWNREHTWAKSHGGFSTNAPAGTDLHHLRPTDVSVNGKRGSLDFDNGGAIYTDPDGATQCYVDGDSWEPWDEVKGDVARMMFYMATRYEGENGEPELELNDQVNNGSNPYIGRISVLLEWNNQDPVSDWEIRRNNRIFDKQHNRNPYIDHPEFVSYIWGGEAPSLAMNSAEALTATSVKVTFSKELTEANAENINNYTIAGLVVSAADLSVNAKEVTLTTNTQAEEFDYTLVVNNLTSTDDDEIEANSSVQFTGFHLVEALVSINFDNNSIADWTIYSAASDHDWRIKDSQYLEINGYGADAASEDWFISPALNATDYAKLKLKYSAYSKYEGSTFVVKVSKNYSGNTADISSANWTSFNTSVQENSQTWEEETVDLSTEFAGNNNIYIAFYYTSSGTGAGTAALWGIDDITVEASSTSSLVDNDIQIKGYELGNYPNPFNPSTAIKFKLQTANFANVAVFNSLGAKVWESGNMQRAAGNHSISFDGSALNSGVYFYSLELNGKSILTRKMMLIK
ncbi:MAG: hypothetical protein B6I17_04150, partial [Tenericutes bacterium 4572_104]